MASKPNATRKVEHHYRDHANVIEEEGGSDDLVPESKGGGPRSDRTFPVRLHYLLSELERDGLDHIIGWQQHGRCFIIRKPHEFVELILPVSSERKSHLFRSWHFDVPL